jgi:DNA helicase-2/ATP-dependent DNA helicase PcrA
LQAFLDLLAGLREAAGREQPSRLAQTIIERTGYAAWLEKSAAGDAESRLENLQELVSAVSVYDGLEGGLGAFLDRMALLSETENVSGSQGVRLMTLHAAKGLEFPVVFLVGLEESVLPHARSSGHEDIEEERRLMYVGMTRARERLVFTRALSRRSFGDPVASDPSRFLSEIPAHLLREQGLDDPYAARLLRAAGAFAERERAGRRASAFPGERSGGRRPAWPGAGRPATGRVVDLDDDAAFDRDKAPPGPYTLGCKVHHPEYGVGTIIGVEGTGDTTKVTVSFSIHGSKKFLPRFAPLEIL